MKPKFTISKSIILEQYKTVEELADITSYSSKTNPLVTPILEVETNCLFSIHTENELKHVKDKKRVLFLAQGWNKEFISKLINQGIRKFVVDNESDLDVLLEYLEKEEKNVELLLRTKLKEHSVRTEKHFVFGMSSEIVNKRILELKNNPKICSLGIHFHRKTQNMAEWNYAYEIQNMFSEEVLLTISILNIGGGLPSTYANTNVDVFASITKKILELKSFLQEKNIKLMIEPGRFICAPAGRLITKIIGIHENNIIVNASVYNSDMDALIVPVKLLVEGELEKGEAYVIKGITPCSLDLFRYRAYLEKPKIGDKIVFLNAGAYNFTTDFCNLEKIETEMIE